MKKNDMLNESTIRRFMKLATIDGLSDKFVTENLSEEETVEEAAEETVEEATEETVEEGYGKDEEEMEEAVEETTLDEEEMDMDMEMGAEEEPMDMAAEAPAAGGGMSMMGELKQLLAARRRKADGGE